MSEQPPVDPRLLGRGCYRGHPAYEGTFWSNPMLGLKALWRLIPHMTWQTIHWYRAAKPVGVSRHKLPSGTQSAVLLRDLQRKGFAVARMPPAIKQAVRDVIQQGKGSVLDGLPGDHTGRHFRGRLRDPELNRTLDRLVFEACLQTGVLDAAQAYFGRCYRSVRSDYQFDADGPIKREIFEDAALPDPQTVYMHLDTSWGVANLIIYLSDVELPDGPFRYIPGSHGWSWSSFDLIIRKAMHRSKLQKTDPENRRLFAHLPRFLQRKAEFGNDIQNGNPVSQLLLDAERVFVSADGDMVLSDNVTGVHRGILLRPGHRREALTIGFVE